jgi:hypothetical protein
MVPFWKDRAASGGYPIIPRISAAIKCHNVLFDIDVPSFAAADHGCPHARFRAGALHDAM